MGACLVTGGFCTPRKQGRAPFGALPVLALHGLSTEVFCWSVLLYHTSLWVLPALPNISLLLSTSQCSPQDIPVNKRALVLLVPN